MSLSTAAWFPLAGGRALVIWIIPHDSIWRGGLWCSRPLLVRIPSFSHSVSVICWSLVLHFLYFIQRRPESGQKLEDENEAVAPMLETEDVGMVDVSW